MQKTINELGFMGVEDIQECLNVSRDVAYGIMHQRSLGAIKLGRKYIVSTQDLQNWLNANRGRTVNI